MIDTFAGLNPWAQRLVAGEKLLLWTDEVTRVYPDDRRKVLDPQPFHVNSVKVEQRELNSNDLAEYDYEIWNHPLHAYTFPDGQMYIEKHQVEEDRPKSNRGFWGWLFGSSDTISFTALQDSQGNWIPESLWTDKEMADFTVS